jgi:hypothetical protein
MDKLSFLLDSHYRFLTLAIGAFLIIGMELLSGEALQPRGPIVERTDNPKEFRVRIVFQVVIAVVFLGLFPYQSVGK